MNRVEPRPASPVQGPADGPTTKARRPYAPPVLVRRGAVSSVVALGSGAKPNTPPRPPGR